jgi:hypothetical protein
MAGSWGVGDSIALGSAFIALVAMLVATWQARIAKRQADATLGDVTPLIFLDGRPFENLHSTGGRASLTLVNQNRRDIRLIEIEFKTDAAIVVSVDSGEMRDIIAAAYQRSRKPEGPPLIIDLREKHYVIQGSSIGVAGSRLSIPLSLTRYGEQKYTKETADITAIVRYLMLDARHTEQRVKVFATVPFRF